MKREPVMSKLNFLLFLMLPLFFPKESKATADTAVFKAGAATSIITPRIGTIINGSMQNVIIQHVHDDTHARALVLDNGETQLAFVVLDLCMVYRETLDAAKERAHQLTGIPVAHMMMSATHTHSAGTACGVFQSDPDPEYLQFLVERTADAVVRAFRN